MDRHYHVYDHAGEHLGSFAAGETAHEWAHLQAALAGVVAPLTVEDRLTGTRRSVWANRCEPMGADRPADRHTVDGSADADRPPGTAMHPAQATPPDSGVLCAAASGPAFSPPRPGVPG
jgi:hypothetical protein